MPYAMGPGPYTQNHRENQKLPGIGSFFGGLGWGFFFFGVGRVVVDFGARFGDFGAHLGGFGNFFGGFGWPLGAQRVDHGTLARRDRSRAECG